MKEILTQPVLNSIYLDNKNRDKVQYLEIPSKFNKELLMNEVNGNGKQFDSTLQYVNKENRSRMVFISAETNEQAFMSITYIAGALGEYFQDTEFICNENSEILYEAVADEPRFEKDEFFDYGYEQEWEEQIGRIPILCAAEVSRYYSLGNIGIDFGMMLGSGKGERNEGVPYWVKCKNEAICIILDDYMGNAEIEILEKFTTNKRVYVVYTFCKGDGLMGLRPEGLSFSSSIDELNNLKNKAILYYVMDEIEVFMPKDIKWNYYGDIVRQVFRNQGIVNTNVIPYDKIVSVADGISQNNMCVAINRIVNYAIKDYGNGNIKRLKKDDFKFLERFDKRKSCGKKKALDQLKNEIVGLNLVKEEIIRIVNVMKLGNIRAKMGISSEKFHNVHVMIGAPGTAKTTVAKLMGEIMKEENLLPGNRSIILNGAQLKGEYVGQSAPKTHAIFENNDIIFIDEAYSLVEIGGSTDSYGNEAIAQLIIEIENHSMDKLIIFAVYGGKICIRKHKGIL